MLLSIAADARSRRAPSFVAIQIRNLPMLLCRARDSCDKFEAALHAIMPQVASYLIIMHLDSAWRIGCG
jgi:hypothetical protein